MKSVISRKILAVFGCLLPLSIPIAAADNLGLNLGMPLSLKGEQHSGFFAAGEASVALSPVTWVDGNLSFINFQSVAGTTVVIGMGAVVRQEMLSLFERVTLDGVVGLEGNGMSGVGVVAGSNLRTQLDSGAEVRVGMTINTNGDLLAKIQVSRPVNLLSGIFKSTDSVIRPSSKPAEMVPLVAESTPVKLDAKADVAPEPKPVVVVQKPEVKASPVQALTVVTYKDIAGHWAKADIEWIAGRGITGQSDKFNPNSALNKFAAESITRRSASFLGVTLNDVQVAGFGTVVTKKDLANMILKVVLIARGATINDQNIDALKTEFLVSKSWSEDSDKSVTRAEAAVIVSKLLQAASK